MRSPAELAELAAPIKLTGGSNAPGDHRREHSSVARSCSNGASFTRARGMQARVPLPDTGTAPVLSRPMALPLRPPLAGAGVVIIPGGIAGPKLRRSC
jgi:hypothetical protein